MYSHEIEQLLKFRNYVLSVEEYIHIHKTSPQISMIQYHAYDDTFEDWTDDRYNFKYKVKKTVASTEPRKE